jgi:hypothetical protein
MPTNRTKKLESDLIEILNFASIFAERILIGTRSALFDKEYYTIMTIFTSKMATPMLYNLTFP